MKKLLLMTLLAMALFNLASCSDDKENNKESRFQTLGTQFSFDARNPEPVTVEVIAENIDSWIIERIDDKIENIENPEWCKAIINNDNSITVSVTPNESESERREAEILIVYHWNKGGSSSAVAIRIYQSTFKFTQEELAEIINKMITDKEVDISYSIGNGFSTSQKEVNKFRVEDGIFKYDGGTMEYTYYENGEANEVVLANDPFEIALTLTKNSHETFYPYNLSEYITLSADDGKNLKIEGTFYLSDYVWKYSEEPANFEPGSFSIRVSGGINMSFSNYIWK